MVNEYIKYYPELGANWSRATAEVARQRPWAIQRVEHSMTLSQLESKLWLSNQVAVISESFNNVCIVGGWYCQYLAALLIDSNNCKYVANYDIDKDSQIIGYKFNRRYKDAGKFIASTKNLYTRKLESRQLEQGQIDLVINPSCEHMYPMSLIRNRHFSKTSDYPIVLNEPLFVLQSTDEDKYEDHINCVVDCDELAEQSGLTHVLYSGKKTLSNGMNRFMVIGR